MKFLSLFLVFVAISIAISSSVAQAPTGYDIDILFEDKDQLLDALKYYDVPESPFHVTRASANKLELYTTSPEALKELQKRSNQVSIRSVHANYNGYYTYETMSAKLKSWQAAYPSRTRLFSLGKSVEGRELWCLEISPRPGIQSDFRPNVKYIGNMHGDEVVGRELLMSFIELLLTSDRDDVRDLTNSMNIFIVPTMNPDGFARGTRGNKYYIDLNRSFPDQYRRITTETVETVLMKDFLSRYQWTLSANFHGGDLVANYPWDGRPDNIMVGFNPSPDDDVFKAISKAYARRNPGMMSNRQFTDGITNGAAWYVLFGGMQDFNYIQHGCMEITLEVSMNKWPSGDTLPQFWEQNRESMIDYFKEVNRGIRGVVLSKSTRMPISGAKVTVQSREITAVRTREGTGAYFRILQPGQYNLIFSAPGYVTETHRVMIPANQGNSSVRFDVMLTPSQGPNSIPIAQAPANVHSPITKPHNPPVEASVLPLIDSSNSYVLGAILVTAGLAAVMVGFLMVSILQRIGFNVIPGDVRPSDAASLEFA